MTTNQTIDGVSRELLYRVSDPYRPHGQEKARAELRALLDAKPDGTLTDEGTMPAAQPQGDTVPVSARWTDWSMVTLEVDGHHRTYVECGKPEQPQGVPVYMKPQYLSVPGLWIECKEGEINAKPFYAEPQGEIETLRAALRTEVEAGDSWKREALELREKLESQPQGEPVAWQIRTKTNREGSTWKDWRQCSEMERALHSHEAGKFNRFGVMREIRPVYAEQPAPVAVVLPERLPGDDGVCTESHYASGWNDCLDEVTRLNIK